MEHIYDTETDVSTPLKQPVLMPVKSKEDEDVAPLRLDDTSSNNNALTAATRSAQEGGSAVTASCSRGGHNGHAYATTPQPFPTSQSTVADASNNNCSTAVDSLRAVLKANDTKADPRPTSG
jgi:hypothetical protein